MNDSNLSSTSPNSPSTEGTRFRVRRWVLFAGLAVPTCIALFYAVENFRGARAWSNYRKQAESRGLNLSFEAHIPPAIPDEDNGAMTPWIRSWFPKPMANSDAYWPNAVSTSKESITRRKPGASRHLTDLVAWKQALEATSANNGKKPSKKFTERDREDAERVAAAPEVLNFLVDYQPALDELRTASKKPRVRYPIYYNLEQPFTILLPHLSKIRNIVSVLGLQCSAELALNKSDAAFNDVLLMLWVTESVREEPFIVDQLVRVACLQITAQAVWEGLAQHRWNDAQLKELQTRFSNIDFFSSLNHSLNAERAAGLVAVEDMRKGDGLRQMMGPGGGGKTSGQFAWEVLPTIIPSGWFRLEAVNYCNALDGQLLAAFDKEKRTIDRERVNLNAARMETDFPDGPAVLFRHKLATKLLLPAVGTATRKFALGQVLAKEAELSCALERYRLAKGNLPETLEKLVPGFVSTLPHDVLTGEPLQYQRLTDTQFSLASIGWPAEELNGKGRSFSAVSAQDSTDWLWLSAP